MKKTVLNFFGIVIMAVLFAGSCGTTKEVLDISEEEKEVFNRTEADTVTIANEETEYEIIIIDPGFNIWLQSIARREGYYSQSWLENRNQILVTNWNLRVQQPFQFSPDLYLLQIDYDPNIDYGYEVNYKLYYYFVYFQRKYNQRLGPWLPRV